MGLTEELKSLEEMNAKGTLTSDEFAAAKAAAIANVGKSPTTVQPSQLPKQPSKTGSNIGIRLLWLAVLVGVIWVIVSSFGKPTDLLKATARLPMDLMNEVESVGANSWRAVPIQIPYTGSLTISAHVMRGNAMMMYLTDSNGLEKLKASNQNTYLGSFFAPQASTFQHTERVNQGTYYFVMRDDSLGILSSPSSDVSVKARIEP